MKPNKITYVWCQVLHKDIPPIPPKITGFRIFNYKMVAGPRVQTQMLTELRQIM